MALAGRQATQVEIVRETKCSSASGAAPCTAGTRVRGGQGRQQNFRRGRTESRRCSCVMLGPQRPRVSKLPDGHLPGQRLWWQARVSPSSACRLGSPRALRSRSVQRRAPPASPEPLRAAGSLMPLAGWMTSLLPRTCLFSTPNYRSCDFICSI